LAARGDDQRPSLDVIVPVMEKTPSSEATIPLDEAQTDRAILALAPLRGREQTIERFVARQ
jgi:hypothetical protein